MNKKYNKPFFKVVSVKSEDVISTSFTASAFSTANGFEVNGDSPTSSNGFGGSSSTAIIL